MSAALQPGTTMARIADLEKGVRELEASLRAAEDKACVLDARVRELEAARQRLVGVEALSQAVGGVWAELAPALERLTALDGGGPA
jgi:hypothetical protein